MRPIIVIALCALTIAGPSIAASPQNRPAGWLRKPTPEDLVAVMPTEAVRRGIDGSAVISCTATVLGTLRDCRVLSETPPGIGFGQAAIALTPQFLMRPALHNGQPVEDEVRIPINWRGIRDLAVMERRGSDEVRSEMNVTIAVWSKAPTVADVLAAYPKEARQKRLEGSISLDCTLSGSGTLEQCRDIIQQPEGHGFGEAAKHLSHLFVGPTQSSMGEKLKGAHTQLRITFSPDLDAPKPLIGKPQWMAIPTAEELNQVLAGPVTKAGVLSARVVMSCAVVAEGWLGDCSTTSEDPPGLGAGPALTTLAKRMRVTTWTPEGLPTVGGVINVPVRYELRQAAAAPKP